MFTTPWFVGRTLVDGTAAAAIVVALLMCASCGAEYRTETAAAPIAARVAGPADRSSGDCADQSSDSVLLGDVDGDGVADSIVGNAESGIIVVCTADKVLEINAGIADLVDYADLNGDGRAEVLAGGTSAWGVGHTVYTLVGDEFQAVSGPSEQLSLWVGLPPNAFVTWGCRPGADGSSVLVLVVDGELTDSEAMWTEYVHAISGSEATVVDEVHMSTAIFDPVDPLRTIDEIAAIAPSTCR